MALVSKLSCVTVPLKNKILVGFFSKPERELGHQMVIDPYWVAPLEILLHKIENKTWVWGERGRGDLRGGSGGWVLVVSEMSAVPREGGRCT